MAHDADPSLSGSSSEGEDLELLKLKVRRAEAKRERQLAREKATRLANGATLLAGKSPSPSKKRAQDVLLLRAKPPAPAFHDSTQGGPPPQFSHADSSQRAGSISRSLSAGSGGGAAGGAYEFASHMSARSAPKPSMLQGLRNLTKSRREHLENSLRQAQKSKSFHDAPAFSTTTSKGKGKEREKDKDKEVKRQKVEKYDPTIPSGMIRPPPTTTTATTSRSRSNSPSPSKPLHREHVQDHDDSEDDDDDELEVTGRKNTKKRRGDWTVIEELEVGPRNFKVVDGDTKWELLEPNSGVRLKPGSRLISHIDLQAHLSDRYHLTPSLIYSLARPLITHSSTSFNAASNTQMDVDVDRDFVVIAVVAWKDEARLISAPKRGGEEKEKPGDSDVEEDEAGGDAGGDEDGLGEAQKKEKAYHRKLNHTDPSLFPSPSFSHRSQTSRKERRYLRLTLVDLSSPSASGSGTGTLNLSLFEADKEEQIRDEAGRMRTVFTGGSKGAYEKFWKAPVGSLVALINPSVSRPPPMPGRPGTYGLKVDSVDSMMVIGQAEDLGSCTARKKDGSQCKSWVDRRVGEVCSYHLERGIKRTGARRAETFNSSVSHSNTVQWKQKDFEAGLKPSTSSGSSSHPFTKLLPPGHRPGVHNLAPGAKQAPYDPATKTGLLPRDNKRLIGETIVHFLPSAQGRGFVKSSQKAMDQLLSGGGGSSTRGGYIAGVREGPSVREVKKERRDRLARAQEEQQVRRELMKKDKLSVGSGYLVAAEDVRRKLGQGTGLKKEKGKEELKEEERRKEKRRKMTGREGEEHGSHEGDEGEEEEKKPRSRPFPPEAIRAIGYDPTRTDYSGLDEDDQTKSKKLAAIEALIATTASREPPSLKRPPGKRHMSSIIAPVEASSKLQNVDGEDDLPALPMANRNKVIKKAVAPSKMEEDDDDDDLMVLPKEVRATRVVRQLSANPRKTHVSESSDFWTKVRNKLVVNPEINTGSPLVVEHRWPQPASRPEKMAVPASKASDVAANPYYERDFRRMYPTTAVVTQPELATLLIAQGGFTSLPAPSAASSSSTEVTADSPAPSLAKIYSSTPAPGGFKPPVPPTLKLKWAPSTGEGVIPHGEFAYFPMVAYSSQKI